MSSAFVCDPMFSFNPSSSSKKVQPRMPMLPPLPEDPATEAAAAVVISREPFPCDEMLAARAQHEEMILRLYSREGLSLAAHDDGRLRLVSADDVHDKRQHWVMDKEYYGSFNKINLQEESKQFKCPADPPCFALVNVETGHAIARHRDDKDGKNYHVSLLPSFASIRYRYLDTSVLWESTDEGTRRGGGGDGNGFRCIRSFRSANEKMPAMYIGFDGAGDGGVVLRRKPAKRGGNPSFSCKWKMVSC